MLVLTLGRVDPLTTKNTRALLSSLMTPDDSETDDGADEKEEEPKEDSKEENGAFLR